jgi:hypothetical protein
VNPQARRGAGRRGGSLAGALQVTAETTPRDLTTLERDELADEIKAAGVRVIRA